MIINAINVVVKKTCTVTNAKTFFVGATCQLPMNRFISLLPLTRSYTVIIVLYVPFVSRFAKKRRMLSQVYCVTLVKHGPILNVANSAVRNLISWEGVVTHIFVQSVSTQIYLLLKMSSFSTQMIYLLNQNQVI